MEGVCCFDRGEACGILSGEKHCASCKFFKTASQFQNDYDRAARILETKGLESYKTPDNIITTRKRGTGNDRDKGTADR